MKILNFGSCNLDYVYSMDHIVCPGETLASANMQIFPGGKGLNQSIATARAGARVFHAGCVGSDGQLLLDILRESGVDTSYLKQVEAKNGHAIIQVTKDGENSIFLFAGSNAMITEKWIDRVLEDFGAGDLLLLQNEINNIPLLVEKAHSKGMWILLNPSPFDNSILKLPMEKLSGLILNQVEAKGFSDSEDPALSLEFFRKSYPHLMIMLTLGKQGCVYAQGETVLHQKAFSVTALDTTAAGDTFTGYFVAGLAAGLPMAQILEQASAASAIAVTRSGAAPSIPTMAEVLAFLESRKGTGL